MSLSLSAQQIRELRMIAQRLDPVEGSRPTTPAEALHAMFGAQAQELTAALLSVRARSEGLTAAKIEQARQKTHSLAWTWLMRGTLHLVAAEDARWLLPLLSPGLIKAGRGRMRQLGWDEERTAAGLDVLGRALADRGPLTRSEIVQLLIERGLPHEGQAPVHLIYRAALEGILCGGPDQENERCYTRLESWLGRLDPLPREEALARLALRYLKAFAPAGPRDLAAWSGLALTEARRGWEQVEDPMEAVQGSDLPGGEPLWLLQSQTGSIPRPGADSSFLPSVRLLPRYDTLWMGYASRGLLIEPAYEKRVNAGGGIVHPMLLVDGQVRGVWKTERKKGLLEVRVSPFAPLVAPVLRGLEEEAADIGRFLEAETRLVVEQAGA